ncbi:hypothetical protein [Massilia sp. YIM B04103]|uniref:hypothetical protein n=1 Tax=Massilia sp. YIM B04103 TaxID=2963106 RepID=UPI002109A669|nr:hypothetical protein [Massilia sp. YIM B04103]
MAEAEDRNTGNKVRAVARNAYDKLGRLYAATDAKGNINITGYDANSNAIVEIHADGGVVRKSYDVFGNRIALEQERGTGLNGRDLGAIRSEYAYDRLGQLKTSKSASVTVYKTDTYGGGGMTSDLVGTQQLTETYSYDALGRRVSVTNALDQTTYTAYDLAGNLVWQEDPTGRTVRTTYDAFHHKTAQFDINGSMSWTVDAYGKVTSHTDMGGGITTYKHNELNQVVNQIIGKTERATVQGIDVRPASVTIDGQERINEYKDGQLVKVTDKKGDTVLSVTTYIYNLAGQRSRERTVDKDGTIVQDNFIQYDSLGRVLEAADNHFNVQFYYDVNGNRTLVRSSYRNGKDLENTVDAYNLFDEMNRETIANGEWDSASKSVVMGKNGHEIRYDKTGLRLSDSYQYKPSGKDYTLPTTEQYDYDAAGRLVTVTRDGYRTDERQYDAAGRVVRSGAGIGVNGDKLREFGVVAETRTYAYDAAGRATRVKYRNNDYYGNDNHKNSNFKDDIYYREVRERGGGYDLAGNLSEYTIVPARDAAHTVVRNNYIRFDGYKNLSIFAEREHYNATTTYEYDAFGNVLKVSDSGKDSLTRTFTNDVDGRSLRKLQNGVTTRSFIVNGELLGESSDELNPDGLASTYEAATSGTNTSAPSIYYAQEGDNLQSIAKALWGDSKLWYLIADANSRSTPDVNAGEMLIIPTRANTLHNDHSTFKPYNQAEQIGDTMPTLPAPAGPKAACGGAGQIVMIVVAVVVTYITAGAAAQAMYGLAMSALTTGQAMVVGAIAGAAGSVASQGAGVAMGMQSGISWRGVAMSAVGGAITAGVNGALNGSTSTSFLAGNDWTAVAGRAIVSNVATQGVSMITGLQKGFNWRSVAAAGVGAAVSRSVSDAIDLTDKGVEVGGLTSGEKLFMRTMTGLASGTASAIARDGKISVAQIATDAFGNALGSSVANMASQSGQDSGGAPMSPQQAERAQYGGLRLKQVLGGEKNYLGMLGPYNGDYSSAQAGGSWDSTVAAWRADNPTYQVLPQVEIFGKPETAEYQLSVAFGLNKKVTFADANPSRIEAQQSIWSTYSNIASAYRSGQIGFGDAASMAWNNTKFAYQGSQRTQGAVQAFNGLLEGAGAFAISGTGVGAVVGLPLAFHGGDNIGTGIRRMWTGNAQNTLTYTGVEALTGSRNAAAFVDNAIPFAGGVASASIVGKLNTRIGYTGAGTTTYDIASEAAYNEIRALHMTDVGAVAQNSGLSVADATTLKKQLFFGRHEYPIDGSTIVRARFAADHEIAFAWQTAAEGELNASQQAWIRQLADHELAERSFMAQGIPYLRQEAWNGSSFGTVPPGAHNLAPKPPNTTFPGYKMPNNFWD